MPGLRGAGWYPPTRGDNSNPVSLVGGSSSLTEDLLCGDLLIRNHILNTAGNWIISSGTVYLEGTIATPAIIRCNGSDGGIGTFGPGAAGNSIGGGFDGGTAGTGAPGDGGGSPLYSIATTNPSGIVGGNGGASGTGAGGFGGGVAFGGFQLGKMLRASLMDLGLFFNDPSVFGRASGGAGGGGGHGDGTRKGGGGGGGGGVVPIVCRELVLTGYANIEANAGNGGDVEAGGGSPGSGGGGSGGGILIVADQLRFYGGNMPNASLRCLGGQPGSAFGSTGSAGLQGAHGMIHIASPRGFLSLPGNNTLDGSVYVALPDLP